jgi:hypothetical protein
MLYLCGSRPEWTQIHKPSQCSGWDFLDRANGLSLARPAGRVREVVQRLPAVSALGPGKAFEADLGCVELVPDALQMVDSTVARAHPPVALLKSISWG